ncbi:hypothetical protein LXL04_011309 [Taraxacum kok-saghyz]
MSTTSTRSRSTGFSKSLARTVLSEIGDKTFFAAAGPKSKKHLTKKRQLDSFSFDRDAGFNLMDFWLDVYIHDYLLKLHACANAFMTEGKVATDPIAIDVPCGFLFEWWSVF